MYKLVLVRHGESVWNKENRFTGWRDADLSEKGRIEARNAGKFLKDDGLKFDIVFTSMLKRAIKSSWIILDEMDLTYIPEIKSWRLNERHYGQLEGLNKAEQVLKYGEEQVQTWRRSFSIRPPLVKPGAANHPRNNKRYRDVNPNDLPSGESLKDVVERFVPFWDEEIAPQIKQGKKVLIVAHGNSLRALVKHLENISDEDIVKMNLPTGMPLIYELDDKLVPIDSRFGADEDEVKRRIEEVIRQGTGK